MKKVKFQGKLSLNKDTVTNLNQDELNKIQGGAILWTLIRCVTKKNCASQGGATCITLDGGATCNSCTGDLCNTCNGCDLD